MTWDDIVDTDNQQNKELKCIRYCLGDKYPSIYFTRREADCMALLLRGKKIDDVADILNLSTRTVEYYIKNMKLKLNCRTKFELVDLVRESNFLNSFELKKKKD